MCARASMFASDGGLSCFWVIHEREASLLGLGVVKGNNLGYRMIPCRTRDDYTCLRFLQSSRQFNAFGQMFRLMEANAEVP